MLQELTRLQIFINKIEETIIKYHNSVVTVCSDRGLHLIDYSYNLQCFDKRPDYVETSITAPKYSPVTELFENSFVKHGMKNSELIQLILDPTLWPHNNHLLNEMTSIVNFSWSPLDFVGNMSSSIAILTNVGCVELFVPRGFKWTSALNLSTLIKESLMPSLPILNEKPTNSKQLQEIAHILATTAICWADKINKDGSCYFVTVQKSGDIVFWLLRSQGLVVKAEVVSNFNAGSIEVLKVNWVPINAESFSIITSDVLGRVTCNICVIENISIKFLNQKELWSYNDRMLVKHFNYTINDEEIILTYTKHRHLVVQLFSKEFNLKFQDVKNINDFKITDLKKQNNCFYLGTINNKLYKVNIDDNQNELKIQSSLVEIKDSYPTSELHGIAFSDNGAICTLAMVDRKVLWRKEALKIDLIFLKDAMSKNDYEISALLSNPTRELTNQWDYIELLRCNVMKAKVIPDIDYKALLSESENNVYNLKIYYLVLILYNNLEKLNKNTCKEMLSERSLEEFGDKIHVCHACQIITDIHKKSQNPCYEFSSFDGDIISSAKSFLNDYCQKYKKEVSSLIDPQIIEAVTMEKEYICQCCDEVIHGFTCKSGHLNMFCSLTFTPIETDDYLVCKACGATARSELLQYKPKCVFCDLYLCRYVTA